LGSVQDTMRRGYWEISKTSWERKVNNKFLARIPRDIGHIFQGRNLCFEEAKIYCWIQVSLYRSVQAIQQQVWAWKSKQMWARFSRQVLVNFMLEVNHIEVKVQYHVVGTNIEVLISARPYNYTDLAHFSRKHICGIVGCCKWFSWLLNVILLLIYFL